MTSPKNQQSPIAPVRRRSPFPGGAQAAPETYDEAEIIRGQSDAILGALGRMQLRIDVLQREQGESLDRIFAAIDRLNTRLDEYEEFAEQEDVESEQALATLESVVVAEPIQDSAGISS